MENKKIGRPTIYTSILGKRICSSLFTGKSLRKICRNKKMPSMSTILLWVVDGKHNDFSEQYKKACDIRAENMFEELLEIADEKSRDVLRARLRVDTRKWYLSKVLPKKFGDKIDVTSGGKPIPILGNVQHNKRNEKDSGA